ncbi:RNA-binding S4 domain-containing protein [Lysobacter sp. TY2-98]|uniref:RNA-binding S4 domain-containing protein n=1 Tax=Lysobacter sp. TY2-98 TaxID=2290922 RepID=UPI000E1FE701|nr:RNA-binding S4 domain-containing protein [Lysobacter sp. TY2-98]AXK71980.1 RNA-binding S4 domain-containing protein [Lysobacter sp. TY2-98]
MTDATTPATTPTVRLDQWLWAARFFRTRSLAKQAIETGRVEIDRQRVKASRAVRTGDRLGVTRGDERFDIDVVALSSERGSAPVAQALYVETGESKQRREQARAERAAMRDGYRAPEQRPDKRARRLIRALGDIDAV